MERVIKKAIGQGVSSDPEETKNKSVVLKFIWNDMKSILLLMVLMFVPKSEALSQWFHVYNMDLEFEFRSKDSLECDSFTRNRVKEHENMYKDDPGLKNQYRNFVFKFKGDTIDQKDVQYFYDYFFVKPATVMRLKLNYDTLFHLTPGKLKLTNCEVFRFGNSSNEYLLEYYWRFENNFLVYSLHQNGIKNKHRYEEFYKDGFLTYACIHNQGQLTYEAFYVEHTNYCSIEKYYNQAGRVYRLIDYNLLLDCYINKNNKIYKKYKINKDRERVR